MTDVCVCNIIALETHTVEKEEFIMGQNSLIQVRVDDELKKNADALFSDLGLDTPTAIRIFLTQAIKRHGLPFDVVQQTPNAETLAAMEEADRISRDPKSKKYNDFSEILSEVMNEI